MIRSLALAASLLAGAVAPLRAQAHPHVPGMAHPAPPAAAPAREAGNAAFAALAEMRERLEADPSTDWSRVSLERLRAHLADMDEVTLRAQVTEAPVEGGFAARVEGTGRTLEAIRRMVTAHAAVINGASPYRMVVTPLRGGVRVVATLAAGTPAAEVAHLRGLGFIGLMTVGAHHQAHHEAIARGTPPAGHAHGE